MPSNSAKYEKGSKSSTNDLPVIQVFGNITAQRVDFEVLCNYFKYCKYEFLPEQNPFNWVKRFELLHRNIIHGKDIFKVARIIDVLPSL